VKQDNRRCFESVREEKENEEDSCVRGVCECECECGCGPTCVEDSKVETRHLQVNRDLPLIDGCDSWTCARKIVSQL
jgi:hypothetical protein